MSYTKPSGSLMSPNGEDLPWSPGRNGTGSIRQRTSMETSLSIVSLSFGLLATVVLAVSVAANYWLHTMEPYDIGPLFLPPIEQKNFAEKTVNGSVDPIEEVAVGSKGGFGVSGMGRLITLSTHSGLWKACVSTMNDQVPLQESLPDTEEDYEGDLQTDADPCSYIDYFGQGFERIEGGETSIAILRGIRKATPVILVSMALMTIAEILSIIGYCRHDYRTIIGGIVSIISALSLVLGQIFYISVVNDEVSQWKKPESAGDGQIFAYGYGWAFYAASSSFLCAMVAAVGQITLFLSRYSGSVRDMIFVVPGLKTRKLVTAETPLSTAVDAGDYPDGHSSEHHQPRHSIIF